MTCLLCRYFRPTEPEQHKQDREAGRCKSRCGNKWDSHTAINYVKNHKQQGALAGWCFLNPEAKYVKFNHVCSNISVPEYFLNHYWRVEPFTSKDNLFEWAEKSLQLILNGADTWREREAARAIEQNVELRRQLKQARKISASRLKRLQKIKDRPIAEPECPVEVPTYPRLVVTG